MTEPKKGGRPSQPVEVNGHRWPSLSKAAEDLGMTRQAVSYAITKGSYRSMRALEKRIAKWKEKTNANT